MIMVHSSFKTQFVREYLRAGSIDRPLNAPPTYDDAMKNVNEAFSYEGEETPPLYSPLPQVFRKC